MGWQIVVCETVLASGATAVLAVALIVHRRRPGPGSAEFIRMALAIAEWSLGSALEVGSPDLETKVLFSKVQYFGIALSPLAGYLYVAHHTCNRVGTRVRVLLPVVPVVTILLCWTNELHHLVWARVWLGTVNSIPAFIPQPHTHGRPHTMRADLHGPSTAAARYAAATCRQSPTFRPRPAAGECARPFAGCGRRVV